MEMGEMGFIKKWKKKAKKALKKAAATYKTVWGISPVGFLANSISNAAKKQQLKHEQTGKKLATQRKVNALREQKKVVNATSELAVAEARAAVAAENAVAADAAAAAANAAGNYNQEQQYQDEAQQYQGQAQQYQQQSNQHLDQAYQSQVAYNQYQEQEPQIQQMEQRVIQQLVYQNIDDRAGQYAKAIAEPDAVLYDPDSVTYEEGDTYDDSYMYGMGAIFSRKRAMKGRFRAPSSRTGPTLRKRMPFARKRKQLALRAALTPESALTPEFDASRARKGFMPEFAARRVRKGFMPEVDAEKRAHFPESLTKESYYMRKLKAAAKRAKMEKGGSSLIAPEKVANIAGLAGIIGLSGLGELDIMVKAVLGNVAKAAKSTNIVITLQQLGIQFPRFVNLTNNKQVYEYINRPYVRSRISSIPGGSGALQIAQYRLAHKTNDPGSSVGQFMAVWGPTMLAKSGSSDSEWQRYADQLLIFCTSSTDAENAYNWAVTKVRDKVRRFSNTLNIAYPYDLGVLCEGVANGYRLVSGSQPLVPVIEAAKNIIQNQTGRDIANKIAAYVAGQVRAGVPAATASAPLIPAPQPIAPDPSVSTAAESAPSAFTQPIPSTYSPLAPAQAEAYPAVAPPAVGIAKYVLPALAIGGVALLLLKRRK